MLGVQLKAIDSELSRHMRGLTEDSAAGIGLGGKKLVHHKHTHDTLYLGGAVSRSRPNFLSGLKTLSGLKNGCGREAVIR